MRQAAKKDSNHNKIKQALQRIGAVVLDTHQIPGLLDMLVGYRRRWVLFEIKDGDKAASAQKLTEKEKETIAAIGDRAPVFIVNNVDEAIKIITS